MYRRIFSMDDQLRFARLSGDFNPIHVDAVAARRLMFGGPIVHGMHVLLWALACWSEGRAGAHLREVRAVFKRPVRVDEAASLSMVDRSDGRVQIGVLSDGAKAATIQIDWDEGGRPEVGGCATGAPERRDPQDLSAADLTPGLGGELTLFWPPAEAAGLLPGLNERLPQAWLSAIATASRLVGVACPGKNSIFGELILTEALAPETPAGDAAMAYRLTKYDARFRYCDIALSAPGMTGRIGAFLRPEALKQPGLDALRGLVGAQSFAGQRALIVGGSRGLGEVSAKLLAAGGGEVILSYSRGAEDAERVVQEIVGAGGRASAIRIDVTEPPAEALRDLAATHLYYFATPFAFAGAREVFSAKLFQRFASVYLDGFLALFDAVRTPALRGVFYPSSVAVEQAPPDMGEYAAAKAAGEAMCRHLANANPRIAFVVPRLPRLDTDQTQTVSAVENADPAPLLADLIKAFALP